MRVHVGVSTRRAAIYILVVSLIATALLAVPMTGLNAQALPAGRLAGEDRIQTAVAVSRAGWESSAVALLATAGDFPDALAAGPLAAALGAPLLLTGKGELDQAVAAELERLGATRVIVLGGPDVVGPAVSDALQDRGIEVERMAGDGRFSTAALIARAAGAAESGDVLLALGSHPDPVRAWPDALSAGAFAAIPDPPPLLLTERTRLPQPTIDALADLVSPGGRVYVIGGAAAVDESVLDELRQRGHDPIRLSGTSRFATSVEAASETLRHLGPDVRVPLILVSGENYPDGLSAAGLAARLGGVLLLTPRSTLDPEGPTGSWLRAVGPSISSVTVVGGPSAVSLGVESGATTATAGPVLSLPAPAPVPAGSPAETITAFATGLGSALTMPTDPAEGTAVSDTRIATLLTALAYVGFTVLDSSGQPVVSPDGVDLGLAIEDWQVATVAGGSATQSTHPLSEVLGGLTDTDTALEGTDIAQLMLDDVRDAAADESSRHHRWASLLVELGRAAEIPHDLLADDPSTIFPSTTQLLLLLTPLAADVRVWAQDGRPAPSFAGQSRAPRPCQITPDESEDVILTWGSAAYSYAYSTFIGHISELVQSEGLDRFSSGTAVASVVLAYTQAALTIAGARYHYRASPEPPVRTRSHEVHGDDALLTVRGSYALGKSELFDCLRLMLRSMNLDFDIPNEGPLTDMDLRLHIETFEGAQADSAPFFGFGTGNLVTDANGEVVYEVRGRKQLYELVNPTPAMATFDLAAFGKLTRNSLWKDIPTVLLDASGGAALLITLPATLVMRTEWSAPARFDVRYQDWKENCVNSFAQVCAAPGGLAGDTHWVQTLSRPGSELVSSIDMTVDVSVSALLARAPEGGPPERPIYNDAGSTATGSYHRVERHSSGDCWSTATIDMTTSGPMVQSELGIEFDTPVAYYTGKVQFTGTHTLTDCEGGASTNDHSLVVALTCGRYPTGSLARGGGQFWYGSPVAGSEARPEVDMTCLTQSTGPGVVESRGSGRLTTADG